MEVNYNPITREDIFKFNEKECDSIIKLAYDLEIIKTNLTEFNLTIDDLDNLPRLLIKP